MRKQRISIDGIDYTKHCTALSWKDYTNSIGRFDARLQGIHDLIGFETVKIYDDDRQVFQGRVGSPVKENIPSGAGMPIGGEEWTSRLKDFLTRQVDIQEDGITDTLQEILVNSPYSLGDVDDIDAVEVEAKEWDSVFDFLGCAYSTITLAYQNLTHKTLEVSAGNYAFCDASRRMCFYSKTSGYFYALFYDVTNSLFSYTSTADFVTWKTVTSLAFDKGSSAGYGLWWDGANDKLYLLVQNGINIDYYRYSEAAGVLTQQANTNTICEGNLICGPMLDDDVQIHFIVEDTTETDYELWEGTADAVWAERVDWAVADNDDPKYMFYGGEDDDDIVVIMFDDDNNDLEQWLYDATAGTITFKRKIDDLVNTTYGYVTGFQDWYGNMHIVWEDKHADGSADLYFSQKELLNYPDLGWTTPEKIIDNAKYDTTNNISLSGDNSGNLYLFYVEDDDSIMMLRRFEETWETSGTVHSTNVSSTSNVRSPAEGLALFMCWRDAGADLQCGIFKPLGVVANRPYLNPDEIHNYENGLDFDTSWVNSGCTLDQAYTNWFSGLYSARFITPATTGVKYCNGVYWYNKSEVFARFAVKVDSFGGVDNGDRADFILLVAGGLSVARFGWEVTGGVVEWHLEVKEGLVYNDYYSGTTPIEKATYMIEIYWKKDAAVGECLVWIDDVDVAALSQTAIDTSAYGNVTSIYLGNKSSFTNNPTTVYIDDFAVSDRKIGIVPYGTFNTELYTASAEFLDWGTLESTNTNSKMIFWSIYNNVPTLLTGVFRTPKNLADAGVPAATTDIYIYAAIRDGYLTNRTYIYTVSLSENQATISLPLDYESCFSAVKKLSDIVGREFKLNWNDSLDVVSTIGEDVSKSVILKTAKSTLYPSVKPNIIVINREPDFGDFANAIKVLGYGDLPDRVEGSAQNEESQAKYGVHWRTLVNKDCYSVGMCNTYATTQLNIRKEPIIRTTVEFYDDYGAGEIRVGDIVRLIDDETDVDESVRIASINYSWDSSGRKTRVDLTNRNKSMTFIEFLARIEALGRWT